jgi:hypothetical protein
VISGYRPTYRIRDDYSTSTHHEFLGCDSVSTGEIARAEVWFLSPEAYPKSLWIDRCVEVTEGVRVVGSATILQILNRTLEGSAAYLSGTWEENMRRVEREQQT